MGTAALYEKLMQACMNGNVADVKSSLDAGADPNFHIQRDSNVIDIAIQIENPQIITLLIEHGAVVKDFMLQKAIEKNVKYLQLLIPDFEYCKDETLLMGVLQAAMNTHNLVLAKQAIHQGAKPTKLFLASLENLHSAEILQLLIENGFNMHADKNMVITEFMGSSRVVSKSKPVKLEILSFISSYYLDKPDSIERFESLLVSEKTRLFLIGLGNNNFIIMKFALAIGVNKDEALSDALRQYSDYSQGRNSSTGYLVYPNNPGGELDYDIIQYILSSDVKLSKNTISSAVYYGYSDVIKAISLDEDLAYGYEVAYKYSNDDLCDYFITKGVTYQTQCFARMKVSAIKGDINALRKAVNDGAKLEEFNRDIIVQVINANQVEILKYLYASGVVLDSSLNPFLNNAMSLHQAYETITYLVELGLDITYLKTLPLRYQAKYPIMKDMWKKKYTDIFDYTIYLAKELYPELEGKEKENILQRIAELSVLPYVIKMSEERSLDQ